MKLLKMGKYICKFFLTVLLAEDLYICDRNHQKKQKISSAGFSEQFWHWWEEIFSQRCSSCCCVSWITSHLPMLLLSTHSKAEDFWHTRLRNVQQQQVIKPSIAQSYSDFVRGHDALNAMLYLDERGTVKCWKKICFNIFSRMVLNSYTIYKENTCRM